MSNSLISQFRRYPVFVFVGVVGVVLNLGLTYVFTDLLGWWYLPSFILATLVTWSVGFWLNSQLTFSGHNQVNFWKSYLKFISLYLLLSPPAFYLIYALTSWVHLHYLVSALLVNILSSVLTFLITQRRIFNYCP